MLASTARYNVSSSSYDMHVSSSSYVQIQEDNVAGIYRTVQQCAEISSEAGGIGIAVHKVCS